MKRLLVVCSIFVLAACAALGAGADTFNKKLLAGYEGVAWVASTATQLRAAGRLSEADRGNIVASNAAAISALDIAASTRAAACAPPAASAPAAADCGAGANAKLVAAIAVIQGLQAYLVSQGATAP